MNLRELIKKLTEIEKQLPENDPSVYVGTLEGYEEIVAVHYRADSNQIVAIEL